MVFFDYYDVYKFIYIHVYNVNKQDPPPKKNPPHPPLSPRRHHPMEVYVRTMNCLLMSFVVPAGLTCCALK